MAQNPKRISKWVRRGVIAVAAAAIVLVVLPFVFPTGAARFALRHSALAEFKPEIGSATLSLGGHVTLRDVVLHEPDQPEQVLLKARVVEADFSWSGLVRSRLQGVRAREVAVHLPSADGQVESLSFSGKLDASAALCQGSVQLRNVNLTPINDSGGDGGKTLQVRGLNFSGNVAGPLAATFLERGAIDKGHLNFESLTIGQSTLQAVDAPITLAGGTLESEGLRATFAGGDFAGLIRYSASDRKIAKVTLTVQHLDQKQVAANLAPDRLDAEGTVSGTINLSAGKKSTLKGRIELTSDGPGRLRIKDQATAEALAKQLQVGDPSGVLPPNFSQIVVGQLRNYPYKEARIRIVDRDGTPIVTLDYTRDSVQPGEAGYDVPTTFQGKSVRANYTIQLPGVTVVLKGKTIDELLAEATGFAAQLTHK